MPRFFVYDVEGSHAEIHGDDARHIGRSLRMRIGDNLTLCRNGIDYECKIKSISDEVVTLDVVSEKPCSAEPTINLTLYQAVPKLDKFETIIQKSVELGVTRIVPVLTRRCVSRPSEKDFSKKLARYRKIALEASKQSGRGIIPEIAPIMTLKEAVTELKDADMGLVFYENGGKRFSELDFEGKKNISVLIGSEGGFDEEEIELVKQSAGMENVWLGNRILRCETAPITAISIIMFLTKNI